METSHATAGAPSAADLAALARHRLAFDAKLSEYLDKAATNCQMLREEQYNTIVAFVEAAQADGNVLSESTKALIEGTKYRKKAK